MLIVSYCWTKDAERLGALIHPDGTVEPELIDAIFRDLAAVHGVEVDYIKQFYSGEYFAWDWLGDPMAMGLSSFQVTNLIPLDGYFRRIRVIWPRCV